MIIIPRTETHAYRTLHVVETNIKGTRKSVAADSISAMNNARIIASENGLNSAIDRKNTKIRYTRATNDNIDSQVRTNIQTSSNIDHVYEEIKTIKQSYGLYENDAQNYYEKHSPTMTKALVNTFFLPRHEICEECTRPCRRSPVYTDRLIYAGKPLFAVEVILCQRDDVSCFNYDFQEGADIFQSQHNKTYDCMLIYSYRKANAAGIFYSRWWPEDVFDLESMLKPSIYVISRACDDVANTQLYHRYVNNCHVRISKAGYAPMIFFRDRDIRKQIGCNNNLQKLSTYETHRLKERNIEEHRRNRSSLLLLEPLLLMPGLTNSEHSKNNKNRVLRSERMKFIRIVIAYILSFFILVSITSYVVYFT